MQFCSLCTAFAMVRVSVGWVLAVSPTLCCALQSCSTCIASAALTEMGLQCEILCSSYLTVCTGQCKQGHQLFPAECNRLVQFVHQGRRHEWRQLMKRQLRFLVWGLIQITWKSDIFQGLFTEYKTSGAKVPHPPAFGRSILFSALEGGLVLFAWLFR